MEMEKTEEQTQSRELVWDCGSSLYDSFELESLQRQLDSAISCRSFSMPHLSSRCPGVPLPQPTANRASRRIPRPLRKLLQSIFKSPRTNPQSEHMSVGFYFHHPGKLSAIPEAKGVESGISAPEFISFTRRTESGRFSSASTECISYD